MNTSFVAGSYTYNSNDLIGMGTFGQVYKACHPTGKRYALKKINKFKIESRKDLFQKLQNQILILQQLIDCQEIIKFVDVFKSQNHYYIVTQYIDGSIDLYKYMEKYGKFPQVAVIPLWHQLLKAIIYLHSKDVMHRDIKLHNLIYIPLQGKIMLIDFGLAVYYEVQKHVEKKGITIGSPLFMSPQIHNNQQYTKKSDIWSLGVVFFFMVTGQFPFRKQKSLLSDSKQVNIEEKLEMASISSKCSQVIKNCLKVQQQDRMSAEELIMLDFFQPMGKIQQINKLINMINVQQWCK